VTFRNADRLRESAAFVADDRLLIETAPPFLAPRYATLDNNLCCRLRGSPV